MAQCRGCGAWIEWVHTPAGKSLPVNPDPVTVLLDQEGDTVIVTDGGRVMRGNRVTEAYDGSACAADGRIAHWSTCPEADRFRKGARG